MARFSGPRFKTARHLGVNVYNHPKALKRGIKHRGKLSEYGEQLLEKQKLKMYYEVMERQFRRYVQEALQAAKNSGEVLLTNLERRLDNIVHRLGFARSLRQARQAVVHGHITVNGERVDRPSFRVRPGDIISLTAKGKTTLLADNFVKSDVHLDYLQQDKDNLSGTLSRLPRADEIPVDVNIAKVLEYYARR